MGRQGWQERERLGRRKGKAEVEVARLGQRGEGVLFGICSYTARIVQHTATLGLAGLCPRDGCWGYPLQGGPGDLKRWCLSR